MQSGACMICINNYHCCAQDSKINMQGEYLCNLFDLIIMVIGRLPIDIDELGERPKSISKDCTKIVQKLYNILYLVCTK